VRRAWDATLLGLLLASNAYWIATEPARAPARASPAADAGPIRDTRTRIEALVAELASAEAERSRVAPASRPAPPPAPARSLTADQQRAIAVSEIAKPWIDALRQVDDDTLRIGALEAVRAAMAEEDPARVEAALRAFTTVADVRFDRAPFRPEVTRLLAATDPRIRSLAVYALVTIPAEAADLDLLLPFADDPVEQVRSSAFYAITRRCGRTLDGAAAEAALRILSEEALIDSALRSLGCSRVSPAIERRFLELYQRPEWRDLVLRFGLCRIEEPSDEVFDLLVQVALGQCGQQDAALDAICHPMMRSRWDRSAGVVLDLLERTGNVHLFGKLLYVGDSRHAERLERMIAADRFDSKDRKRADTTAAALRKQAPRTR
jgi:hypothetical protein